MDREKVVKGLEHCFHGQECCGDTECPYYIEHLSDSCCLEDCQENLKVDAIALLKEHEAVKPIAEDYMYKCGDCKWSFFSMNPTNILYMMQAVKFCPHCGKPIDWEGR